MMWSQIKSFLQTIPERLYGSHIEAGEEFTSLSSKARFPADEALERRIQAARGVLPPNNVKAVRKP